MNLISIICYFFYFFVYFLLKLLLFFLLAHFIHQNGLSFFTCSLFLQILFRHDNFNREIASPIRIESHKQELMHENCIRNIKLSNFRFHKLFFGNPLHRLFAFPRHIYPQIMLPLLLIQILEK